MVIMAKRDKILELMTTIMKSRDSIERELKTCDKPYSPIVNQLLWLYVRFNKQYIDDYNETFGKRELTSVERESVEAVLFSRRWYIKGAPIFYGNVELPTSTSFVAHPVLPLNPKRLLTATPTTSDQTYKKYLWERFLSEKPYGDGEEPMLLLIHQFMDKKQIVKAIDAIVSERCKSFNASKPTAAKRMSGQSSQGLVQNAVISNLWHEGIATTVKDMNALPFLKKKHSQFNSDQIKKRRAQFQKNAAISPWCFFSSPKQHSSTDQECHAIS